MPAMAALRENFHDARVTLVVSSECADLFPAMPNIDRILITRRNLRDVAVFLGLARERLIMPSTLHEMIALPFLPFYPARGDGSFLRVREQSKTRARIYKQFVGNRMRICTQLITISLWRSRSSSQRFPRGSSGVAGASP